MSIDGNTSAPYKLVDEKIQGIVIVIRNLAPGRVRGEAALAGQFVSELSSGAASYG